MRKPMLSRTLIGLLLLIFLCGFYVNEKKTAPTKKELLIAAPTQANTDWDNIPDTCKVARSMQELRPCIRVLDLESGQLHVFPVEILQHPQLIVVRLRGNYDKKMPRLPEEIARMENLKSFYLENTAFTHLPEAF